MKVAVIGTGYVGLVTGTCLAESGNDVVGVDKDARKIETLHAGKHPDLRAGPARAGPAEPPRGPAARSPPTSATAVRTARLIFIAVGTPQSRRRATPTCPPSGPSPTRSPTHLKDLPPGPPGSRVVVIKSTVPVGTNAKLAERLRGERLPARRRREQPGVPQGRGGDRRLHEAGPRRRRRAPAGGRRGAARAVRPVPADRAAVPGHVARESAEMTKYAANAMLATKISFINEMANLCDRLGADINDVRRGIGHDQRIGFQFLFPGPGYGGSCFPKDVQAIIGMGRNVGLPLQADAGRGRRQRGAEAGALRKDQPALRRPTWRARRWPSGAWRSSRGPTTSARRRPWR